MRIRTTKPDLLILDTCHPKGAVVDVPDAIGKRLVRAEAAVPIAEIATEEPPIETATIPPAPRNAARRV